MTTKEAARPLSPRGVWRQKLRNVISSVLGIKNCAVFVGFKHFGGRHVKFSFNPLVPKGSPFDE